MDRLPMAPPYCSLDEIGLSAQLDRYRNVGEAATLLERSPQRVRIQLGKAVPDDVVSELIEVEKSCCPFFDLRWDPSSRQLSIGVSRSDEEPALDALVYALGSEPPSAKGGPGAQVEAR
jgi:hypothetical protein